MKWFLKCLKQYADFRGRARRKEYWMFTLFYCIFALVALILDIIIGTTYSSEGVLDSILNEGTTTQIGLIEGIFNIAILIPSTAVSVRRLHDIGRSGWWLLLVLLPIIGLIWLIVWAIFDSHPETNEWGPNPKANDEEC